MGRAVYPGTFDPVTLGHLDVIRRGAAIFDELVVAVAGGSVTKDPLFSESERSGFIRAHTGDLENVTVEIFDTLAVEFVRSKGFNVLLRGIRTVSDFEYEFQMALTNRRLAPEVETVFVMPRLEYSYVSARLIREIVGYGGPVSAFVPEDVAEALRRRISSG